jgi:hypothetical protein
MRDGRPANPVRTVPTSSSTTAIASATGISDFCSIASFRASRSALTESSFSRAFPRVFVCFPASLCTW